MLQEQVVEVEEHDDRPRLERAMDLLTDEVIELLAGPLRSNPRVLLRVERLLKISKAIGHQRKLAEQDENRLAPEERARARGRFNDPMDQCMVPPEDRELGLADGEGAEAPDDQGGWAGPLPMRMFPIPPHPRDGNFETEKSLALLQGASTVMQLVEQQKRVAKLDELGKLQKLLDGQNLDIGQRADLQNSFNALLSELKGHHAAAPAVSAAPDHEVVPPDDVR